MTQKELSYIEDIYNHEILIINILDDVNNILGEKYNIKEYINEHKELIRNLNKIMEDNIL